MLSFFRLLKKGLSSYIFIPINIQVSLFTFSLRKFLFGFSNSNKMLERLSQPCLIPILKRYGAHVGKNCDIGTGLIFHNCVLKSY